MNDLPFVIRAAQPHDISRLASIESAAAQLLRGHAPPIVLAESTPEHSFVESQAAGRLWVATYGDVPVGFAQVKMLDDEHPHLDEIDVHPTHGRRGAGTQLVKAVCAWAREAGYRTITLGTFRDVPFNRPFYARLGFDVVAPEEYEPGMRAIVEDEAARGLDTTRRVIMRFRTSLAA